MTRAAHSTAYERTHVDERVIDAALATTRQGVFWEEDAGPAVAYPDLRSAAHADLVVVGGGFAGLWTALLAKRRDPGRRVVLVESRRVGWAASGRNGGFCEASITHGEENGRSRWPADYDRLDALGYENLDAIGAEVEEFGLRCDWSREGTLTAAVEEHQLPWLAEQGGQVLDAEQTRATINSPLFLGGVLHEDNAALVHPVRLARELAREATDLGAEIHEHTPVTHLSGDRSGPVQLGTPQAVLTADQVVLATNVFPSLLKRNRLMTVPVYDYILVTEPLTAEQRDAIGWHRMYGLTDMANQFHYSRPTADGRILYGGYDAIYHAGRKLRAAYDDRPASYRRLAKHFLATFPQLQGIRFSHKWGGAIDTSTQFAAFFGLARQGRVTYAAGFTGLGVGATRFAGNVMLDLLAGADTELTRLEMVRKRPLPFPPEPAAAVGINLARWSLNRADHRQGHRNLFLRALDTAGLGFDS